MTIMELNQKDIIRGIPFRFREDSDRIFIMRNEKWNDYGYYTYYTLNMYLLNKPFPFGVAVFRIMYRGQKEGEFPSENETDCISFVQDIGSAEGILYFLTPEERKILEDKLNIRYDSKDIASEPAFRYSILRSSNVFKFNHNQRKIEDLIKSTIDFKSIVENNKDQLLLYLELLTGKSINF